MTSHQHLPANHLRVQHHHKREKCDGNDAALHSACELRLGACLRQSVKAQHGASQIYSTMWLESSVVIRAISSVCCYPVECSLSSSCTRILPVIRSVFLFSEPCCMLHVFVPPALSRTDPSSKTASAPLFITHSDGGLHSKAVSGKAHLLCRINKMFIHFMKLASCVVSPCIRLQNPISARERERESIPLLEAQHLQTASI